VKTVGTTSFVQVFDAPPTDAENPAGFVSDVAPRQVPVEVGISNDTSTEIVSGLKEGERYAIKGSFMLKAEQKKGELEGHNH
jgi:multidrug efflux pump subunit AcrA (membrane-fusion protein)